MKRGEREAFTIYMYIECIHSPKGLLLTTVPVDKAQEVDDEGDDEEVVVYHKEQNGRTDIVELGKYNIIKFIKANMTDL